MSVLTKNRIKAFTSKPIKKMTFAKPTVSASIIKEMQPEKLVKGTLAKSSYEWIMAQALDKNEISYAYQVPFGGGSLHSGGVIVDFIVYTNVEWAIDVRGSYWHQGDDIQFRVAMHKYNSNAIVVVAYDADCQNISTAESFLRRNGII